MSSSASHPEIQMPPTETHSLTMNEADRPKPAEMVSVLYSLPADRDYNRGYKAPMDILSPETIDTIAKCWPKTKLIVGLRHPIMWFESYYKYV